MVTAVELTGDVARYADTGSGRTSVRPCAGDSGGLVVHDGGYGDGTGTRTHWHWWATGIAEGHVLKEVGEGHGHNNGGKVKSNLQYSQGLGWILCRCRQLECATRQTRLINRGFGPNKEASE